jgi:hypothetical protein
MSTIRLLDCAIEYARLWVTRERQLVTDFAAPSKARRLAALQRAGGYFRISRNFPMVYDVEAGLKRLAPALAAIDRVSTDAVTSHSLPSVIASLRRELGRSYGDRDLLSAATKFLWLRHREVVIIFDRQARLALGTPSGDYDRYLTTWYSGYADREVEIEYSCSQLASSKAPLAPDAAVDQEVRELAGAEWFRRRVYDGYLWKVGRPGTR